MQVIQGIDYFYLFAATFFIVGLLTPLMRKIAIRADIIDRPTYSHKTHKAPVPYLGGVAITLGILIVSYGGLILKNLTGGDFGIASSLLIPATILGIIGLLDDRKSLPPLPRFIAQSIAGIFTAVFLIATNTVGNPSGNSAIDALITILWVVGITNAINFFDNLDGGMANIFLPLLPSQPLARCLDSYFGIRVRHEFIWVMLARYFLEFLSQY